MRFYYFRFSFMEIVVTLGILLSLVMLFFLNFTPEQMNLGPKQKNPSEVITETNLKLIYQAIMGDALQVGYYRDMGLDYHYLPRTLADLFQVPSYLPESLQAFDPKTRRGWRGLYLTTIAIYGKNFEATYGSPEDPAILDGWGRPIVLQIEFDGIAGISEEEARYARLVSAGKNGMIDTPLDIRKGVSEDNSLTEFLTKADCKDDLVLFLQISDPRNE